MPMYRVWYRDNPEPLEFSTAGRCSDKQILDHVLAHEHIVADATPAAQADAAVSDLIAQHKLGPVRYSEDESEIYRID